MISSTGDCPFLAADLQVLREKYHAFVRAHQELVAEIKKLRGESDQVCQFETIRAFQNDCKVIEDRLAKWSDLLGRAKEVNPRQFAGIVEIGVLVFLQSGNEAPQWYLIGSAWSPDEDMGTGTREDPFRLSCISKLAQRLIYRRQGNTVQTTVRERSVDHTLLEVADGSAFIPRLVKKTA